MRDTILRLLVLLTIVTSLPAAQSSTVRTLPEYSGLDDLARVVILDQGRCKPLDSWAWETMRSITGRLQYQDYPQLAMLLDMNANPDVWFDEPLLRIDNLPLRKALGLPEDTKHFSFSAVRGAPGFEAQYQQMHADQDATPTGLQQHMQKLYGQMILCSDILSGQSFAVVPDPTDPMATWSIPAEPLQLDDATTATLQGVWQEMIASWNNRNESGFNSFVLQLSNQLQSIECSYYPSTGDLEREILYNQFRPFRKAIVVYLLLGITGLLGLFFRNRILHWFNNILLLSGVLLHSWGLYFITVIAGRAPMSNLYESLLFIIWGFVLIAFLFNLKYREQYVFVLAGLIGFIAMVLAHHTGVDITINPLVPVLKSSWLVFHVTIILISYSAFGLTMGLGHIWLISNRFFPGATESRRRLYDFTYRVLQLGIVTLTVGIILGAMWANESWGRYWGWDPKETWSLITLLIYLGVVHARARGWVRHRGMAILNIISFASVIMTYYGVNYFLSGLHSYAGGSAAKIPALLLVYIGFEIVFLLVTTLRYTGSQIPASKS
jgi:cytochrome c-type biogenesis protein CcsB